MSTILPPSRSIPNWLVHALQREYCPAIEPYLGWLRQPVGWFALAVLASLLVGVTIAPVALSLAAGLLSLMAIGLAYPWLAVRLADCELVCPMARLVEDEAQDVEVRVRNRCPWPLWGLIVERFVVYPTVDAGEHAMNCEDDPNPSGDIALGAVPAWSRAMYRLAIRPRTRGRYPRRSPQLTCSFPFGIWTARREIKEAPLLIVHPKQVRLVGMLEHTGRAAHHSGQGSRSGGQGEFLGLRDYRVGDSMRHVHWAHTARLDQMVVCERSAADQSTWQIVLDTSNSQFGSWQARENLAWRVRIAASLCTLLHQQSIAFQLTIQGEAAWSQKAHSSAANRLDQALERLTDIPLDGVRDALEPAPSGPTSECRLMIDAMASDVRSGSVRDNLVRLQMCRSAMNWRHSAEPVIVLIDLDQPIASQINAWLQRTSHDRRVA